MIASRFNRKVSRFITKTYLSKILQQLKKEMCKWVMPIFGKHSCCFSGFQPAQQISEWTCWLLSALLYMCRLICACTTAICLMWLFWVWFFFGISKVAAIRLKRACISVECIFVCNIFEPAFQLRKKKKKIWIRKFILCCTTAILYQKSCCPSTVYICRSFSQYTQRHRYSLLQPTWELVATSQWFKQNKYILGNT